MPLHQQPNGQRSPLSLERDGFVTVRLSGGDGRHTGAYTIGLLESFGHPDLVCRNVEDGTAVVTALGHAVANDYPSLPDVLDDFDLTFEPVGDELLTRARFRRWRERYAHGPGPDDLWEVVLGSSWRDRRVEPPGVRRWFGIETKG